MPDNIVTDERLLEIIVQMFHRGEINKIRLANKAIAKFEASRPPPIATTVTNATGSGEKHASRDRSHHETYDLLMNRSTAATEEARAKVTEYVNTLFEAGERDPHRLTVCGLTYLRELDGSTDPVKAGYTGL